LESGTKRDSGTFARRRGGKKGALENYEIRKNEVRPDGKQAPAANEHKNTVVPKLGGEEEKGKKEGL
jgi:hypothetical protein